MGLTADEFMTQNVVCVNVTTTLQELAEILISKRISGVPVLDEEGKLAGVISKTDLLTHGLEKELSSLLKGKEGRESVKGLFDIDNMLGPEPSEMTVEKLMKTTVITAAKNTDINKLVTTMMDNRIHRIIITEDEKVVGVVTTMDILRMIDTDD